MLSCHAENIGLVYIPVRSSKVAVWAGIYGECRKQSDTESKHKQTDTLAFQNNRVTDTVTLNSEMDFYLRNGRNGDFLYEMELLNSILFII